MIQNRDDGLLRTDHMQTLKDKVEACSQIDPELYAKYEVKRGLRDISGRGVLAGLTEIGEVHAYIISEGEMIPCPGRLSYRGIDVKDLVNGFMSEGRFGFEEATWLLLFGSLPSRQELAGFSELLDDLRTLPEGFVRDIILKAPSKDLMNALARSVLSLYSYDDQADDASTGNVLAQSLYLIANFPSMAVYAWQAYAHYFQKRSLFIHNPIRGLSTAENFLHMLRPDSKYTALEASILDLALVLHAEHGGGNNSTFTAHVVTSSGTDTYSAVVAALGSLKGPRHGGANVKVAQMFDVMKKEIKNWNDDGEISDYLGRLLDRQAFDKAGLIYGMGHAVYSLSDPRAEVFQEQVGKLAESKGLQEEYEFFSRVERLAPEVIGHKRKIYKGVSANVDFWSGFVYRMLDIPPELFTPLFAVSRIVGWSAHRIEEIVNNGKIIRPAYKSIAKPQPYMQMDAR